VWWAAARHKSLHNSSKPEVSYQIGGTPSVAVAGGALAALLIYANAAQPLKLELSDETVGAEPKSFLSVVGVWRIEADRNN
jgi:hypothetical protein